MQDDFDDIGSLLDEIASSEGPGRDHGTVDERQGSFRIGLEGGLYDCNDYSPTHTTRTLTRSGACYGRDSA